MMKILIPVDGSKASLLAVHHALRLVGAGLKARFVVANVQESANLYELVVAHDPQVLQQVSEAAGRDLVRPAVALLSAAGQQVETAVASGDPAHMLAEILESHACDAVIMSARGGGLRAAVLGSVSQEMVQLSVVPVTLVKVPDETQADD
ncbi:universal stress protein [Hydrogenophaga sp.]|jgi:nucleotide-binding universal stress UspA family protein|uniref:universal stress protein n=1 Tax=Hydrogenophaga sp. TaxID=1904254 RepID=UPI003F72297D